MSCFKACWENDVQWFFSVTMSLFKARDWWSATLGEGEEFDQGCLCVGDVDNSGTGYGQYVMKRKSHKQKKTLACVCVEFHPSCTVLLLLLYVAAALLTTVVLCDWTLQTRWWWAATWGCCGSSFHTPISRVKEARLTRSCWKSSFRMPSSRWKWASFSRKLRNKRFSIPLPCFYLYLFGRAEVDAGTCL